MKRLEAALLAGLIVSLVVTVGADFSVRAGQVRSEVLRLHVLAASDDPVDQAHKLAVRDSLLAKSGELFASAQDVEQAIVQAGEHLEEIEQTARQTLRRRGCADKVSARVVTTGFDTRSYGGNTLPAGQYRALQVVIGEGKGHNWWCVMYPPLCLPAACKQEEQSGLEDIDRLTQGPDYRMGFAVVELWEKACDLLRKNA